MKRTLAIAAVLAMAPAVHAEEPSWLMAPPSPRPPQVDRVDDWYGDQTILVDLLSVGSIVAGFASESPTSALVGLAGLWFGAPAIHLAHGESARAMSSFLMRPALAVGGAYLGVRLEDCSPGDAWCGLAGGLVGSVIGIGVASAIDAAWSYELTVAPILHPRGESYGLGLTAAF